MNKFNSLVVLFIYLLVLLATGWTAHTGEYGNLIILQDKRGYIKVSFDLRTSH